LFCFEQKTCKSFNYADYASVRDGEENCELHNEINDDDGNSLEFLKDDRYTFYQIPGASHEPENTQTIENATEQVYIYLPLPASKFQSRSRAIFYPTMGTTSLIYLVIPCFYQFITPSIRSLEHHLNQKIYRQQKMQLNRYISIFLCQQVNFNPVVGLFSIQQWELPA
jgi:hypothetical protein